MDITYTKQGDYLISNLTLNEAETRPIGKYGMLRKTFLKKHRKGTYSGLILSGKLDSHLADIDQTAREQVELIMDQLLREHPAPDKATDQMAWVGHMNSLKHQAEEAILRDLIYS